MLLALVALVAIQFIRPERNTAGYESVALFEKETKLSSEVSAVLKKNCYDCHSNQTQYPWYAEVAPFSLFLAGYIEEGKKHFNVSEWQDYSIKKKEHKLEELMEMVEDGEMPLKSYSLMHGNITSQERTLIMQWAGVIRLQYKHLLEVSAKL